MPHTQTNLAGIAAQLQALASAMQTMTVQPDSHTTPPLTPNGSTTLAARVGVIETAVLGLQDQIARMEAVIDKTQASIADLNEDLKRRNAE